MEKELRFDDPEAKSILSFYLAQALEQKKPSRIVCLCIGTDRSTGDALGPLVGTFLSEAGGDSCVEILGTLANPIHAGNLEKTLEVLQHTEPVPFILAVDACLGKANEIGLIKWGTGHMSPGKGIKKNLPAVGEFHVKGVVNAGSSPVVLQNTRLSLVYEMARVIAYSLIDALRLNNGIPG
jgi:putative sporulation protein YyaC